MGGGTAIEPDVGFAVKTLQRSDGQTGSEMDCVNQITFSQ